MKTILTKNLRKATKLAMNTIKNREMGVISGLPGMGKSTFREMLIDKLRGEKYGIAYYVPFKSPRTQTNRILGAIYEAVFPEQDCPVNEMRKLKRLQTTLNETSRIVLVIDNMQNLDLQTIREIKIIWEELRIVPVLFFLKSDTKILGLLDEVEIGQRVNHYTMAMLDESETLQIATKTMGIKFEDKLTQNRFVKVVSGNPLTIKHFCKMAIEATSGKLLTLKTMMQLEVRFINLMRKQNKISIREIEHKLLDDGKEASRGFVSEVLTGKRTEANSGASRGGARVDDVLAAVRKLVEDKNK
jgi:hypothetical protein